MSTLLDILSDDVVLQVQTLCSDWLFASVNQETEPTYILDTFYNLDGTTNVNGDNMWKNLGIRTHLYVDCEVNLSIEDGANFILRTFEHSIFELAYRWSNGVHFCLDENQGKKMKDTNAVPITNDDKVIFRVKDFDINEQIQKNNESYQFIINGIDKNIIQEIVSICLKIY